MEIQDENKIAFNNIVERVVRFVLDVKHLKEMNVFSFFKDDYFQIQLLLDDHVQLSDHLVQVVDGTFMNAMSIPKFVHNIKWQLIRNGKDRLTEMKDEEVGLEGKIIRI